MFVSDDILLTLFLKIHNVALICNFIANFQLPKQNWEESETTKSYLTNPSR